MKFFKKIVFFKIFFLRSYKLMLFQLNKLKRIFEIEKDREDQDIAIEKSKVKEIRNAFAYCGF